jgi:hypothetical protein
MIRSCQRSLELCDVGFHQARLDLAMTVTSTLACPMIGHVKETPWKQNKEERQRDG